MQIIIHGWRDEAIARNPDLLGWIYDAEISTFKSQGNMSSPG